MEGAYTITETVHSTARTTIYRAVRGDGQSVILKVLGERYSGDQLDRLRNEQEIVRTLQGPGVVRAIGRDNYRGRPALVLEDFGGQALDHRLVRPLSIEEFLPLATNIARCVADLHQQNVVHKDLKPANLLVHPSTLEVKIVDFGLACALPASPSSAASVRTLEGSLPYVSPEQTGRTNRLVDQRSDLYSLGVTFFEMLTGQLPFQADDPVEWVHCHIARRPPAPSALAPSVPTLLSDLVLRLLAKEPDDRYQTARGLAHDLARCKEQWQARGELQPFPLGARDVAERLQIPHRLYGRERELADLQAAFARVAGTGAPELVLVAGYSGIGKSALVHELRTPIEKARGRFASGKFDRYRRDIPYSTIVQAFGEVVREILGDSEPEITRWRERLRQALGANAALLLELLPQLELVVGPQPPAPPLPPGESQNRFRMVFRNLVGALARTEHPLTIFLDDLQWADSASLALLSDLLTQVETCHLLLIGAYRDNEVGPSHPLTLALEQSKAAGARLRRLELGPLSGEQLQQFVEDLLHCGPARAALLAALLQEKTGGNPFFTIQFLTSLHDERLLTFDGESATWRWDNERIRGHLSTDNVADLLIGKLRRLQPGSHQALQRLACLGTATEVGMAKVALELTSDEQVHAALLEAVRAGLLTRLGDRYRFPHDRIHEAAYSLIPEGSRAALPLTIGRAFLQHLQAAELDEHLFDVVNLLNQGVELITDAGEQAVLCRLNRAAGMRAKDSIAYLAACHHFARSMALLPPNAWETHYQETLDLTLARAECEYLVGNFEAADGIFHSALDRSRSNQDRARVHLLRVRLYQMVGRYDLGLALALEAFRLCGVTCPQEPEEVKGALAAEFAAFKANLAGRRIADLIDAPPLTDPEARAAVAMLGDFLPCAYNTGSPVLPLYILRVLNLCLRQGNSEQSCLAYTAGAMMLASVFGEIDSAYQLSEMSLRLHQKLGGGPLEGTLLCLHGFFINFLRRPFATSPAIFARALAASLEVGDFVYAAYNGSHAVWHALENGDPLDEVLAASGRFAALYRQIHNGLMIQLLGQYDQFVACLQGRTRGPTSFDGDAFSEADFLAQCRAAGATAGFFINNLLKEMVAFIHREPAQALAAALAADPLVGANLGSALEVTHHFYCALILIAALPESAPDELGSRRGLLEQKREKLQRWAESCPENFLNRHLLVSAEVARVEGRPVEAMRLYEQAIRSAADNGLVHQQALAAELAARFYRAEGLGHIADTYLAEARICYARWGALHKVRQIDQELPPPAQRRAPAASTTFTGSHSEIDLMSVTKACQAISGEIALPELMARLVQVVLEQAGAERGYLLLRRQEQLTIEAEARLDEAGAVRVQLLRSKPLESSPQLAWSVVNYVARTRERVQLASAGEATPFAGDAYLLRQRPRSTLCLPIIRQGEVAGVLYLENNLVRGAFTSELLPSLELLAAQAAISLEHALLLEREQAARQEAVEALRLREEFLTVASHELRTPMASLTLNLQTLQGQASPSGTPPSPEGTAAVLELAQRQARRLNRLIGELLEVSRIQSGPLALEPADTDLVALVREALARFTPDFAKARCAVALQADPSAVGRWDRSRLDQVVENLVSNAIKFGAGRPIEVEVRGDPDRAHLVVRDHGIGVPIAQQTRIFERFGRAVSDEHYGGLGLGLYICRHIVAAHAGSITVASRPGEGAIFTVELPRRPALAAAIEHPA
jgi:predicted ATPase/signal transduction histidine kinase/tRNA A-37 threonylcarbamoyl transferase component Bud32